MSGARRNKGGCFARLIGFGLLLTVVVIAAGTWVLLQPYRGFEHDVFIDFQKGTGSSEMANELAKTGVIRNHWLFMAVRALRPNARLQAGEYRFSVPASVWTVFDRIVRGDVFYYEITTKEGANIFEIAKTVDQLGFIQGGDFLAIAKDPTPIHDLAPEAPTLEGFLFPSTYRLTRHTTAAQLCHMMTNLFRKRWAELEAGQRSLKVNRVVTLASLIEKETGLAGDRATVASVYVNRLEKGMRLECDPTTIYAAELDGRYRGVIHRSDLDNPNPYNTYQHAGLPPGPIANPGLASLQAAIKPAKTDYLFFVVRPGGLGASNFSKTLAEHNRHVQEYRQEQGR